MLTGSTPIGDAAEGKIEMLEKLGEFRTPVPKTPSQFLAKLDDSGAAIAQTRSTGTSKLTQILKGDLDWIVTRSLSAEPSRRYETASALRDDIQRFLDGEPVVARPPSKRYQLSKFVSRNLGFVTLSGLSAGLLIVGLLSTSWLALSLKKANKHAIEQKELAVRKSKQFEQQKNEANEAREIATDSAKRSSDILSLVVTAFGSANPEKGGKANIPARVVLNELSEKVVDSELDDKGKAEIYRTLFDTFNGLGLFDSAVEAAKQEIVIRKRASGELARETLTANHNLAMMLRKTGKAQQSVELHELVLQQRKDQFGDLDPDVLMSMNNLVMAYHFTGRRNEALALQERTLLLRQQVLGDEHPDTILSMNNLGVMIKRDGQLKRAEQLLSRTLQLRKKILGAEHAFTLNTANNLANVYSALGKVEKARQLQEKVLEVRIRIDGELHPRTQSARSNLCDSYLRLEMPEKAIPLLEAATRLDTKNYSGGVPGVAWHDLSRSYSYFQLDSNPDKVAEFFQKIDAIPDLKIEMWRTHDIEIRKAINTFTKLERPDSADIKIACDSLGSSLEGLRTFDAENKTHRDGVQIKRTIYQATTWLIRLSKKLGDEAKVAEWQAQLDLLTPVPSSPESSN